MKTKLSLLLGISALAFLFSVTPVLASEVNFDQSIENSGPSSSTNNDGDAKEDVDIDKEVKADIDNKGDVDCKTGEFDVKNNTNAEVDDSGACNVEADWQTAVNGGTSLWESADGGLDVNVDQSIEDSGPNSSTNNDADVKKDVNVDLDLIADILNKLDADLATGDFDVRDNTNAEIGGSGDASLAVMFETWANNDAGWSGAAHGGVSVTADQSIKDSGPNSSTNNDLDVKSEVDWDVEWKADVDNKVDVNAKTGEFDVKNNTNAEVGGSGDVDVAVELFTSVNNGGGASAANGSGLDVNVDQSIEDSGPNSSTNNDVDVKQDVDVKEERKADVDNNVEVDANTGVFDVKDNTNAEVGGSGDVNIQLNISTEANNG